MSLPRRIARRVFEILAAAVVIACAFFILGFIFGWLNWIPKLRDSRLKQAVNWGLFSALLSFILDPVLFFSLASWKGRKSKDRKDEAR